MKFEIERDTFGLWHFRLLGGNNQVVAVSNTGYTRRRDAVRAVNRVQEGAADASIEFA